MPITAQPFEYQDGEQTCVGYLAWDESYASPKPGILINHAWGGLDDFAKDKAIQMAALGYVGLALDHYGDGDTPDSVEAKTARMTPFMEDRAALLRRLTAGYEAAANLPMIDANSMAAMGFCFGGLCTLDMARGGLDLKAAISFHGLLTPNGLPAQSIKADVLVCHGWDDPMATPDTVVALGEELGAAGCDWTLMGFGNTVHAFMVPEANDAEMGTVYNEYAATQAWMASQDLLSKHFALHGTETGAAS